MRWNSMWLTRSVWSYLMRLRGPRKRQRPRKTQLRVEPLEDRYAPAVITPTTFNDGLGIGSLRDAVLQASTNRQDNIIELQPGTYNLTMARGDASGVGGSLDLNGAGHTDIIEGAGAGLTIISAEQTMDRVFQIVGNVTVIFRNLTITGGEAIDTGSRANTVQGLSLALGGGILNDGGNVTLDHVAVVGNEAAGQTGSIFGTNGTVPGLGGGVYSTGGLLTIVNSTIANNKAVGSKGSRSTGITVILTGTTQTTRRIEQTTTYNFGGIAQGGGLYVNSGLVTITNSTVANNIARQGDLPPINGGAYFYEPETYGGGIYLESGSLALQNDTIADNQALAMPLSAGPYGGNAQGGGLFNDGGTVDAVNTIIAANIAQNFSTQRASWIGPDVYGKIAVTSHDLIGNGAGSNLSPADPDGNGNIVGANSAPVNPDLGPLADNGGQTETIALLLGSPAIGAGTSTGLPATDQRDLIRTAADIGAFAFSTHNVESPAPTVTPTSSSVVTTIAVPSLDESYYTNSWSGHISGTASAPPGDSITKVEVSIEFTSEDQYPPASDLYPNFGGGPSGVEYWNGTAFATGTEVFVTATGTTNWSLTIPASKLLLIYGANYTVHVVAIDTDGTTGTVAAPSSGGAWTTFTYFAYAPMPPAPPTKLLAASGNDAISLTWNASTAAVSYDIYRGSSLGGESLYKTGITGTSFTDTGLASGATYYYEVTAVNKGGKSDMSNQVSAPVLGLTPASLPADTINIPYNQTQTILGGSATYSVLNVTGLPAGLTASIAGAAFTVSGTPTVSGVFPLTITLSNDNTGVGSVAAETLIVNPALTITTLSLPAWTENGPTYDQTIATTGGTGPLTFALAAPNTLPAGLTLNSATGLISGTPSLGSAGAYSSTVDAIDSLGAQTSQAYTLVISPAVNLGPLSFGQWTANRAGFIGAIPVSTGTGADTLTVTSGRLPIGMKASVSGGAIGFAGKPTTAGTYAFTLRLTDHVGASASQGYTIVIRPATAFVWTGGGGVGSENWSDPANWSGAAPAAGDVLIFGPGATQKTANNDFLHAVAAIAFQDGGYTITGNAVRLTASTSIGSTSMAAGTDTLGLNIALTTNETFIIGGNTPINVTGTISGGSFRDHQDRRRHTGPTPTPPATPTPARPLISGGALQLNRRDNQLVAAGRERRSTPGRLPST